MLFWISGEVSVPSEKRTVWMPKGLINASPKPAKIPHPSAIRRRLGMASGRDRQLSNTSPARNSTLMMTPTTKAECRFAHSQMKGGNTKAESRPAR